MPADRQAPAAATDRIFGHHEAAAMFEAINNALAILGSGGSASGRLLAELRAERELLLTDRLWLARLYDAVQSQGPLHPDLVATLKGARDALDAS